MSRLGLMTQGISAGRTFQLQSQVIKIDLADQREVYTEEGTKLAQELGVEFIEVSAKAGINIKALFKTLASNLPGNEDPAEKESSIKIKKEETQKLKGDDEEGTTKKSGC